MTDRPAGRLRVAHVIDTLAATGGAERRLVEEVLALGDRFDQRVVRLYERGDLDDVVAGSGTEVVALGARAATASRMWPFVARRLRAELRRRPVDVVHTSLVQANLVGQLAARPLGIPVVSTLNRTGDPALRAALQPGADRWRARLLGAIGARAARGRLVQHRAVSEHAATTWAAAMGLDRDRVMVIPRAIIVEPGGAGTGTGRERFGLAPGGPLVVAVGRLTPEKGHHLLVAALAGLRERHPGAQLAIAGAPGANEAAVRAAAAAAGLDGAVTLLGHRDDVPGLLAAADVFACSSLSEGAPTAVLEAMGVGVPVVAFDIPPVAELTAGRRAALLVPAGSVPALAAALADAAAPSPARAERVAAGRELAAAHSPAAVARQLGDLLERAAAERRSGGP